MDTYPIYWLPTLYVLDNNRKFRMFRAGWTPGFFHSETGLLYKADGSEGKIVERTRKIPINNRSETAQKAAETYAHQEWEKKQRIDKYNPSDIKPTLKDIDAWYTDIKWPAVCKSWGDCKPDNLKCDEDNIWYGQGKVNGDRAMAWQCKTSECNVKILSRKCIEKKFMKAIRKDCSVIFDHISNTWPRLGNIGLDGEIYAPNKEHHQQSRSIVSRTVNRHENEDDLVFVIFDLMEYTLPFEKRQMMLKDISKELKNLKHISLIRTRYLKSDNDIKLCISKSADEGYDEGIVLRRPYVLYTIKKEHKHKDMVKLKRQEDAEYVVIGYKEGNTDREGCVVWKLRDRKNKKITFWCTQIGTVEYQRQLFSDADTYMGRLLTVEFATLSADGVPIFPHATIFRDDEDLVTDSSE